ncbi:TonB-dependent receptor [Fusobacterium sp. MFO224]|uniref:TonB-dependent receptor n=1 Tax=Fusobacterium sp. MFO224 TaxID=3378070 RepID=UPI003852E743
MRRKIIMLGFVISALAYADEKDINLGKSVVTSTTGFETSMRKIAANPTIITSEDIEAKNYKTVLEALRHIPSVNIMTNSFGTMIDLRGQGGIDGNSSGAKKNVQILVDGIAINSLESSMTSTPIDTISVDTIEKIEVIPGGGSVIYGSGTAGGIVNIITKKGEGFRGRTAVDYTNFDGSKESVSFGNTFGKFDVDLAYTNDKSEGYREDSKDNSEYFQGKIRYNISEKQDLEFKHAKYNNKKNILDDLTKEELSEDRDQGGNDGFIDVIDTNKDDYILTYNNKLSGKLDLNLLAYHQQTSMKINMPGENSKADWNFEDKKKGSKLKLKYSYGEDNLVLAGIDYVDNTGGRYGKVKNIIPMGPMIMEMKVNTDMDLNKKTLAGFIMNNYKYDKFQFNQGIRYEKSDYDVKRKSLVKPPMEPISSSLSSFDKKMDNVAWELSGNYLYSDTGKSYIRYEKGFTTPQPALLTNKYNKNYYLNDLNEETYNSIEVGLSDYYKNTLINGSVFYSLMNDEIYTYMSGGMANSNILNYNLDKTERYGVEFKLEHYLGKLTLSEGYQYMHAKIKDGREKNFDGSGNLVLGDKLSGNKIAGVPEHKLNIGANYKFNDRFNINGEVVYNGSSYIDNKNKYGKKKAYIVANIRANYKLNTSLNLYAGINNLFDEHYNNSVSYDAGISDKIYDPAAERNYYMGFSYTF